MEKLRVVLANMPQILLHILRDLVDRQPDMAVVGEVRTMAELSTTLASSQAEALILTLSPPRTGTSFCKELRAQHPGLTLLALAVRTDRAVIWPPNAPSQPVELSATAIVSALRTYAVAMHRQPMLDTRG